MINKGVSITYLGHSTFKIKSPRGKTLLIDPWVESNPVCPEALRTFEAIDIMAITHGHFDHMGDAVALAKKHKPHVVCIWEIGEWLASQGVEGCFGMNKGGTQVIEGIKFTMTHAQHSSGIKDQDGRIVYAGDPAGYVIEFENGFKIYHAGDTCVFGDMKLIAEIYQPELAMLPIGDFFTMSPLEASYACRFLSPKWVIPIHYATFPVLTGTPEELKELTKDIPGLEIIVMKPGDTVT